MSDRIEHKYLYGHHFGVLDTGNKSVLFDTVPAAYASEWLDCAPNADVLVLCSENPYPKSVAAFLDARPDGVVYAAAYTLYVLRSILGDHPRLRKAVDHSIIKQEALSLGIRVVTQSGRGAYLQVDTGEGGVYCGNTPHRFNTPVEYETPTVVIAYVSGCDYTETIAEEIAKGILDSENLDAKLIDLASVDTSDAVAAMINAAGILIGTPTVNSDAESRVWKLLSAMPVKELAGKPAAAFGYYTRSGQGMQNVIERMKQLNMNLLDNGFNVQYCLGDVQRNGVYEYGYAFGCTLQNKPNTHRSSLVKCLICGDVFDAALGACPVCGVGMDKCVPVDDEEINVAYDSDRVYVIAGGGIAGVSAAEAIRKRDKTGTIHMISAEDVLPVNRPMLSKNMVKAAKMPETLCLRDVQWFETNQIELRLNTRVKEVDPEAKAVLLSDGSKLHYDRLIWAAGAECFVPEIPGKDRRGVLTVRHLSDVFNVWSLLPTARNAVVIGGGVLGLELAAELKKMRLRTTVLELAPRIMSRQLDDETGERLMRAAEEYGVKIHTGVSIADITGTESVSGVRLNDGTFFPADIVVISCGNKATIGPVQAVGAECGRAVKVNTKMETSLSGVYACGDCAEIDGVNFQLWAEATEQGRVAGANAAGDALRYDTTAYGTKFEGMNTRLFAIGDVGGEEHQYKKIEIRNEIEGNFRTYWFCENRLCGGVFYGNTQNAQELVNAFECRGAYAQIKHKL